MPILFNIYLFDDSLYYTYLYIYKLVLCFVYKEISSFKKKAFLIYFCKKFSS